MFDVKEGESEVEQSNWNECETLRKVAWTFQGDFPTVAQTQNERSPNASFTSQCSNRTTYDVQSKKRRVRSETEQVERTC